MGIEVRLLGRFAVLRDGEEIPPSAFRQRLVRTLVRVLLSRRGEFTSRDLLTEALWPGRAPADPGANLRVLVTLARKALGNAGLIQGSPGGYAFNRGEGCVVDAELFEAELQLAQKALVAGKHEQALRGFRSALQLWHGEPLAEDVFEDWALEFRSRLLRARIHALEGAAESSLGVGEPVEAVEWGEQAAAAEPLREHAHALLIEALAASGDTARALAVYESFRRRLADDLGLDPSADTQELQGRILRGEVGRQVLLQPLPLPADLAVEPSRVFVGRGAELEAALEFFAGESRSRLAILWLLGEPGIGKTRLATEIARRIHCAGGVALFGRCTEELEVPYQPFMEALQWYVSRVQDPELARRLGSTPGELVRLVPAVGARIPDLDSLRPASPEIEQHRLFEAIRTWLAAAGGNQPVVMVLDDVHWAAPPTLDLLGHIGRSAEPSNVLLICTARNTPPDENETLFKLMDELDRRGMPSLRMSLGGLSLEAVGELVASVVEIPDDRLGALAGELHAQAAGNPLFIDSLLRGMSDDPAGSSEPRGSLADTVAVRVAALPAGVAAILGTASVAGQHFDLKVIARAAGREELETLESLEIAGRAGLLEEYGPDRFRFRHAVVRTALRSQMSRSRRARVHLQIGEALEAVYSGQLEDHAGALAHHFVEAVPVGGAAKAYRYTIASARHATRLLAHEQAAEAYGRALELVGEGFGSQAPTRYDLLIARSEAQRKAGDVIGALSTLQAAVNEAVAQSAPHQLAEAAIAFEDATFWLGVPEDDAVDVLNRAETVLPEQDSLRPLLLGSLSRALLNSGRPEGALRRRQALAAAGRLGDPGTTFRVEFRTAGSTVSIAQADLCAARWARLCRKAREVGDTDAYLLGLAQSIWATVMLGDLAAADRLFAEYSRMAVQLRQPRWDAWLDVFRALRALLAGDLATAERLLRSGEQIGERFGWAREGLYGVAMFLIRREQGRLHELSPLVQAAVGLNPSDSFWRPGLAALFVEIGKLDEARREYEHVLLSGELDPSSPGSELSLGLLAETCAALGDTERARRFIEHLAPCEGRLMVFLLSAVCLGPADRLLGMMASTAGLADQAERWLRSGLELSRRLGSPLWIAHCLYDSAVHLQTADRSRTERMLSEAAGLCAQHSFEGLGARVASLRAAG